MTEHDNWAIPIAVRLPGEQVDFDTTLPIAWVDSDFHRVSLRRQFRLVSSHETRREEPMHGALATIQRLYR